jgi:predicted DNA-binding protein with PD1-like motif
MSNQKIDTYDTHVIRLKNGEDVLEGLEREIKNAGIENGLIINGIGSTTSYHIHVVETQKLPPGNTYFKKDEPFDIVNMQGYIMNGRVHAHISLGDAKSGNQFGGHLEKGCKILTFCIITIIETEKLDDMDDFEIPDSN